MHLLKRDGHPLEFFVDFLQRVLQRVGEMMGVLQIAGRETLLTKQGGKSGVVLREVVNCLLERVGGASFEMIDPVFIGQGRRHAEGGEGQNADGGGVFAGQHVGIREVADRIWLVSFMQYDLGFFDEDANRVEPAENPFGPKVLPM